VFACDTSLAFASAETPIPNVAIAKAIPNTFFICFAHLSKKLVGLYPFLERARPLFKTPLVPAWLQAICKPQKAQNKSCKILSKTYFNEWRSYK
jgi:hypothetical protein